MAKLVLTGVRTFTHGLDITGVSNKVELKAKVEDKIVTNYLSAGWHEHLAGLGQAEFDMEGFWEAGTLANVDDTSFAALGSVGPWTVAPIDANEASLAYLSRALRTTFNLLGAVGDVAPFTGHGEGSWPLARGQVASNPGTARTVTGTGTILTMTGPLTGQYVYGNLHVLSVAGTAVPTITARIESATVIGFGSPTTRATFTAATAIGGEAIRAAGPITDGFWRLAWTITGTGPSFLVAASIGVK